MQKDLSDIKSLSDDILENQDRDKLERYGLRSQWSPEREHRVDKAGGPVDFMGDESFYKPSRLGFAHAEPNKITAGETNSLKLKYTCGAENIYEGTSVRFYMRGQQTLGCRFQINEPDKPGYVKVLGPLNCKLEPLTLGFKVCAGTLKEGDVVEIIICEGVGFKWTPLAGRYEYKVVFNYGEGIPERRLPEPVVITVNPGEFHHLEGTLPCTVRVSEDLRLHITARDKFDNRVLLKDIIFLKNADKTEEAWMINGMADYTLKAAGSDPIQLEMFCKSSNMSFMSSVCIPSEDYNLYIGDLHVHDFLSEAHQYTDKVYDWAIEDRNLDFVSVSIQNHGWIDNEKWTLVKYMNERYLEEGRFVTLLANEWQHTSYGDKVIHHLGGDQPFLCVDDDRAKSARKIYDLLREGEAVVISHHSSYPAGSWCGSTNFDKVETDVERLTELWSMHGSSEGFDLEDRPIPDRDIKRTAMEALRKGLRIGFVAGSDTHSGRPGGSAKEPRKHWGGLAAVWAKDLTRRSIFEALSARRTYALTGARIILKMTVNGAIMGSEISAAETADIEIDVWAPNEIKKVQLIKNTFLHKEFDVNGKEFHGRIEDITGGPSFYHCRVILEDGHLAVCSPVWVG